MINILEFISWLGLGLAVTQFLWLLSRFIPEFRWFMLPVIISLGLLTALFLRYDEDAHPLIYSCVGVFLFGGLLAWLN